MKKLPYNPNALLFLLFFVGIILLLPSCKTSKKIANKRVDEVGASFLREQLIRSQVKAEWLTAKVKLGFEGLGQKVSATATIKMRKDSVIWMTIKKLGFEVARVQLSRDSVYVIDRLNNQYFVKDLDYLEKQYNLPADFNTIQAILLGNPVFYVTRNMKVEHTNEEHHLYAEEMSKANHFWLTLSDYRLTKMSFTDHATKRDLVLSLQNYSETSDRQNFSYLRNIDLNSRETGEVSMEIVFSKVTLNEPETFRFEIPTRYTRVD